MSALPYVAAKPQDAPASFRAFDNNTGIARRGLLSCMESGAIEGVLGTARDELRLLAPGIAYLGENNIFMKHLLFASQGLALCRALRRRHVGVQEIGRILCTIVELQAYRVPWIVRRIAGRLFFTRLAIDRYRTGAEISRRKEYSDDGVFSFMRGNGRDLDCGIDVHECGLMKYFRASGAEDMVPYLCSTDFIVSRALGEGLTRTATIARGGDRCDFRFKRKGTEKPDWTPAFLDRRYRVAR